MNEAEVRSEVWHSLVSMLRVYAHAASLNGKPYAVTAATELGAPGLAFETWVLRSGLSLRGETQVSKARLGAPNSVAAALIQYEECSLTISFSPETGWATWSLIGPGRDEEGHFQIDEHGAVHFPDGPKELDTAAIDWMYLLSQPQHAGSQL